MKINALKTVVAEPRASGKLFESVCARFYREAKTAKGAVLFAVCRGKVSEGLDFADENARGVVVVGIPFPFFKDLGVVMKMQWNDSLKT